MGFVDFKVLEEAIKKVERVLGEYNLVERELILKEILGRLRKQRSKQEMKDMVGDMPLGSLLKRTMKAISSKDDGG